MYNFDFCVSTQIFFGKGQVVKLGPAIKKVADKVLLVYGGGSIKRNGVYDDVVRTLNDSGVEFVELPGVEPNPRVTTVKKGGDLCKEHGLQAVLAAAPPSTAPRSSAQLRCMTATHGISSWTARRSRRSSPSSPC